MRKKYENKPADTRHEGRPDQRSGPAPPPAHIYGVIPVLEALRSHPGKIERIVIATGAKEHRLREVAELARANGVTVDRLPKEGLSRLAGAQANHQGVLAFAAAAEYVPADDILDNASDPALFLVLDGIEDPRNLGAVLRTAECAGVDGVFVPERRAARLNETVVKSSAGATEYVKVAKVTNLNRLIDELKSRGIWVVGTDADAAADHVDWDWSRPTALVLGSEGSGLHRLVAENCDVLVKIPMYGKIGSLNVSVAAGVILFEAVRQRNTAKRSKDRS
ncbi:MAG: 23S rRNA (guanosine(2251)-2'-O)-methyltransferase RlmB [Acidobacteriota bacterium]